MIADQQRVLHGSRGNFKGLHHKGADKQRQDDGDNDRFEIFTQGPLFFGCGIGIFRFFQNWQVPF